MVRRRIHNQIPKALVNFSVTIYNLHIIQERMLQLINELYKLRPSSESKTAMNIMNKFAQQLLDHQKTINEGHLPSQNGLMQLFVVQPATTFPTAHSDIELNTAMDSIFSSSDALNEGNDKQLMMLVMMQKDAVLLKCILDS